MKKKTDLSFLRNGIKDIKKTLSGGAIYIIAGNFLTQFAIFFGSIFLVRALSKEDFGLLSYIENIYGYIYIFAGMGLINGLLRYIILSKDNKKQKAYYIFSIKRGSIINISLVLILISFVFFISLNEAYIDAKVPLIILILIVPFQFLIDSSIMVYRAKFSYKLFALSSVLISILIITSKYFGAITYGLLGVSIFRLITVFFTSLLLILLVIRRFFPKIKRSNLSKSEIRDLHTYSFSYMLTNGIWVLIMLNNVFLLGIFNLEPETIADFKVATVLPNNLALISSAIGVYVGPYFVKNEKNFKWIKNNFYKIFFVTLVFVLFGGLFILLFSKQLILIIFGVKYLNIIPLMNLLLVGAVINSAFRFTIANILSAMGKIKYNFYISIIGLILQVTINLLLIPVLDVYSVAIANIAIYSVMSILLFISFHKQYLRNEVIN